MRTTNVVEHIPTFPGEFDEFDSTTLPTEEIEVTELGVMARNRAPATLPPQAERTHRPTPQALYDEAPDPSERTPATWDMGQIPGTFADAEVTEELDRRPANLQSILRATEIDELETPIGLAMVDFDDDMAPTLEAEKAPKTAEVELELLEEWLELPSQGHEPEPDLLVEFPSARDFPSDPAFPTAGRYESAHSASVRPPNRFHYSAPQAGLRGPASGALTTESSPDATLHQLGRKRLFESTEGVTVRGYSTPLPLERRHIRPATYDSNAETLTDAVRPLTVRPAAERVRVPRRRSRINRTWLENAGWWAVGALTGALGGTTLASSLILIAAFI